MKPAFYPNNEIPCASPESLGIPSRALKWTGENQCVLQVELADDVRRRELWCVFLSDALTVQIKSPGGGPEGYLGTLGTF